ncbi:MAG: hypothetical protein WCL71_03790, partial [Deltaproteobacteria bacterium]
LDGIRRLLDQKRKDLLLRETQETEIYGKQFNEMLDFLKYDSGTVKKEQAPTIEKPRSPTTSADGLKPAMPKESSTAVESPKTVMQPVETPKPSAGETLKPLENVIVPATGSTL